MCIRDSFIHTFIRLGDNCIYPVFIFIDDSQRVIFRCSASKPYWLATGWTTNSSPVSNVSFAYCIVSGGTVDRNGVYFAYFAPRPALYLKSSILVSVETEDEGKALANYRDVYKRQGSP